MNDIINIFYKNIINEAATGRIDCLFVYNIIFSTNIVEENIHIKANSNIDSLIIPTLTINNKNEFNKLLTEYVIRAKNFYNLDKFKNEIDEQNKISKLDESICIEKIIMTLLWSNATYDDFQNPIQFLKKRIAFFDDNILSQFQNEVNLGYSEILKSYIQIKVCKDKINNETPYFLEIKLISEANENEFVYLPDVRLGIFNNNAYIYAIQNRNKIQKADKTKYEKYINRTLFKIGENYVLNEDDDLKDVTASFVISGNIALGLIDSLNVNNIFIPSILIPRWNGAIISDKMRAKDEDNIERMKIQSNLTQKFLRTFRRISYHNNRIKINSYPFEIDSYMHMSFDRTLDDIKNPLLRETYYLIENKNSRKL